MCKLLIEHVDLTLCFGRAILELKVLLFILPTLWMVFQFLGSLFGCSRRASTKEYRFRNVSVLASWASLTKRILLWRKWATRFHIGGEICKLLKRGKLKDQRRSLLNWNEL